jgi:nucleosome binding factor SPN SPT16 subunit
MNHEFSSASRVWRILTCRVVCAERHVLGLCPALMSHLVLIMSESDSGVESHASSPHADGDSSSDIDDVEEVPTIRTRHSKRVNSKENQEELARLAQTQRDIRARKIEELRVRLLGQGEAILEPGSARRGITNKLTHYVAYDSPEAVPADLRKYRLYVDQRREVLFVPVSNGSLLPVNIRSIKGITKSDESARSASLRLIFHTPGAAVSQSELFPHFKPDEIARTVFIKELSVRAEDSRNMSSVFRTIKELQKRQRVRDQEQEQQRDVKEQPKLILSKEKRVSLKDVNIRPQIGMTGRSRAVGNLEAHETGFRFNSSKGEHVDVIYTNIKHLIYQPCEHDQLVLIHINLIDPIIVGKKKTYDIQFYTETRSAGDDLNLRRRVGGYDPDEILEEQREREMIDKLNKMFKSFVKQTEETFLEQYNMDFDMPYRELGFQGTPAKSNVDIFPCRDCLISVSEWPPFVLTIEDIDIVYFERVSFGLRNFDMVFVFKDYSKTPARVSSIPIDALVPIKQWLGELSITWYEGPTNMNWNNILKEVIKDKEAFVEANGWEGWFGEPEEGEESDEDDEDSEYTEDSESGDEEEAADSDDEDAAEAGSDESSYADDDSDDASEGSLDSDESEGLDWEELERKAAKADKKKAKKSGKDSGSDDDSDDDRPKKKKRK